MRKDLNDISIVLKLLLLGLLKKNDVFVERATEPGTGDFFSIGPKVGGVERWTIKTPKAPTMVVKLEHIRGREKCAGSRFDEDTFASILTMGSGETKIEIKTGDTCYFLKDKYPMLLDNQIKKQGQSAQIKSELEKPLPDAEKYLVKMLFGTTMSGTQLFPKLMNILGKFEKTI